MLSASGGVGVTLSLHHLFLEGVEHVFECLQHIEPLSVSVYLLGGADDPRRHLIPGTIPSLVRLLDDYRDLAYVRVDPHPLLYDSVDLCLGFGSVEKVLLAEADYLDG